MLPQDFWADIYNVLDRFVGSDAGQLEDVAFWPRASFRPYMYASLYFRQDSRADLAGYPTIWVVNTEI
jgi:hypothetical protein